jgi:hypothetical protein
MESVVAVVMGIGLAASCGFRVFVPLLVASAGTHAGYLEVASGFEWLGSWPALIGFGVAAAIEIISFYVPWIDHILDAIASPFAVAAGIILFAASLVEFDPFLQWSLAVIAGGGSAAVVQGATVVTRAASTMTTGGLANFVVSTFETLAGVLFSVLSIVVPIVALALILVVVGSMYYFGRRVLAKLFSRRDSLDV